MFEATIKRLETAISNGFQHVFETVKDKVTEDAHDVMQHTEKTRDELKEFIVEELKKVIEAQEKLRSDVNVALKDIKVKPQIVDFGQQVQNYIASLK